MNDKQQPDSLSGQIFWTLRGYRGSLQSTDSIEDDWKTKAWKFIKLSYRPLTEKRSSCNVLKVLKIEIH